MSKSASPVDPAGRSLEHRLAIAEQMLITLLGVVHSLREEVEGAADDEHIDP